jgi:hypothetical protein
MGNENDYLLLPVDESWEELAEHSLLSDPLPEHKEISEAA